MFAFLLAQIGKIKGSFSSLNNKVENLPFTKMPTKNVDDFNSYTQNGFYWCGIVSGTTQNAPPTNFNGVLMVFAADNGDGIVQIYVERTGATMYTRAYKTSWTEWAQK